MDCYPRNGHAFEIGARRDDDRINAAQSGEILPSSAKYTERHADTASANKKRIATERTKSDMPVPFLAVLFARFHADLRALVDMLNAEATLFAMFIF